MGDMQQFFAGGQGFDPNSVDPQGDFEVLPPGKYPVQVESAEIKQTKAGTGHYIYVTCKILDGPAKGRLLWDRMNIDNPSQVAVGIGQRCLAALGIAIGVQGQMTDTDQLLGGQCMAHVKVKEDQNEIRTYSSFAAFREAEAKGAGGRPAPAPAPAPAAPSVSPAGDQHVFDRQQAIGRGIREPALPPIEGQLATPITTATLPVAVYVPPGQAAAVQGEPGYAAPPPVNPPATTAAPAPAVPSGPMPWAR